MENASKALIIAGAILLSILIISLGLIVYNQAKETIGSVNLSEHEIATFNQKFATYEGQNVAGTTVNNLLNAVIASNTAAVRDNTGTFVTIQFPSISSNHATDNYLTMGVGNDATDNPEIQYVDTLGAKVADVTALPNPMPDAANIVNVAPGTIKVQPGQTYKVTMSKNTQSGLYEKILVEKR